MRRLFLPQKNMYEEEQFFGNTSLCNIGGCIFLKDKEVDLILLDKAINKLIEYSDALRTVIVKNASEVMQSVNDYAYQKIEIAVLDPDKYKDTLSKWTSEVFDITKQMVDFKILVVDNKIGVFVKVHHVVCDAWGGTIIASKILEYYKILKSGEEIKKDIFDFMPAIDREDKYLESNRYLKDKEFWESKYAKKPSFVSMSPGKLSNMDVTAGRSSFVVPMEETIAIRKYCIDNMISPAVLLEAITMLYSARINNSDDVTLCSIVVNRDGAEEKNCIGMFNTILPFTIDVDYNETFSSFCQRIALEHMQVFKHQKYPLSNITNYIRENHSLDNGIYDIMVSYQNAKLSEEGKTDWIFNGASDLGFMLNISERDNDGKLYFDFDWRKNCFNEAEVEAIYYRFINMVNQIIVAPDINLKDIEIITPIEKNQILVEFNNTLKDYPREKCLHLFLEENATLHPDKIALEFENKKMTYKEFNERVNELAHYIIKNTTKRNSIIAIMIERSFEMMIAIYASIKAGHSYMPMDPHFPKDRIEFMLEDSEAPLILTETKWIDIFEKSDNVIDLKKFDYEKYDKQNPDVSVVSNDTAYVIYTSGSTGKPKGALIPHHSAINRILWMHGKYPLEEGDVILQKTPYTFDVSVWELFWWSMVGGTLKILIPEGHKDPREIVSGIYEGKVTHMHFVPSMLNAFLEYLDVNEKDIEKIKTLKYVFASGEALGAEHVKKFYELLSKNGTTIHNLYGPTECTVDVSYYDCDKNNIPKTIPIGKPVDNTQLLVLDKNHKLLPVGVVGELYISGVLVGKGYLKREELTREKFVPNIYYNYATMYKTGDLAMWLPDGNIEYLGRTDFQVKIRGLRVELGDIESSALKTKGMNQVLVTVFEANGEKNLCLYYTSSIEIDESNLKHNISKDLPDYMVPQYYVRLDKIPTNANGKADRKALPIPEVKKEIVEYVAPKNELEEKVQKIISESLKIENLSTEVDLFTCGLTSIGVISIITKLSAIGFELKVRDFYECHTIVEIANLLANDKTKLDDYKDDIENYQDISDIENYSLPLKEGNSILLTGATSFLGIHIIEELIKKTDKKIYCLFRTKDKFERFLRNYTNLAQNSERIIPVFGDIRRENLDIADELLEGIKEDVTDIIHCAADVNFFSSWEKSRRTNYVGTCMVVELAKSIKARLHYMSTMSVSGDILARQTREYQEFSEDKLYIGQVYEDNVYVHSKYLAEKEVIRAIRAGEINASIYRLANLTWRMSDGMYNENYLENDLYMLTKVMYECKMIPLEMHDENLSLAPVDEVASAIVSLLTVNKNKVYNLYSNHSLNLSNYMKALTESKVVTLKEYEDYLTNNVDTPEGQFMKMYIANIINSPDKSIVTFENDDTIRFLKTIGFEWKVQDDRYAKFIEKYL